MFREIIALLRRGYYQWGEKVVAVLLTLLTIFGLTPLAEAFAISDTTDETCITATQEDSQVSFENRDAL